MATISSGSSATVSLDSDDQLTITGKATIAVTPTTGSKWTSYVDGTTTFPPNKQAVSVVITAINDCTYSTTSNIDVDTHAVYATDSQGNVVGIIKPDSTIKALAPQNIVTNPNTYGNGTQIVSMAAATLSGVTGTIVKATDQPFNTPSGTSLKIAFAGNGLEVCDLGVSAPITANNKWIGFWAARTNITATPSHDTIPLSFYFTSNGFSTFSQTVVNIHNGLHYYVIPLPSTYAGTGAFGTGFSIPGTATTIRIRGTTGGVGNTDPTYTESVFTATTGTGTAVMNISAVTEGQVVVGQTISGGTLSGTATITSFGTFNGVSGTVNLSTTQTFANPTTVTGTSNAYGIANDTIWIGDIYVDPPTPKAKFLVCFDDCKLDLIAPGGAAVVDGTGATNIHSYVSFAASYNFPVNAFIITGGVLNPMLGYMNQSLLAKARDEFGVSFGAHSHTHPNGGDVTGSAASTGLRGLGQYGFGLVGAVAQTSSGTGLAFTPTQGNTGIIQDLTTCNDYLNKWGFGQATKYFSLPQGGFDIYVNQALNQMGYKLVRGTNGQTSHPWAFNTFILNTGFGMISPQMTVSSSIQTDGSTTQSAIQNYVDYIIANGAIGSNYCHAWASSASARQQTKWLFDYLAVKKAAGLIDVVSMYEL